MLGRIHDRLAFFCRIGYRASVLASIVYLNSTIVVVKFQNRAVDQNKMFARSCSCSCQILRLCDTLMGFAGPLRLARPANVAKIQHKFSCGRRDVGSSQLHCCREMLKKEALVFIVRWAAGYLAKVFGAIELPRQIDAMWQLRSRA
jgi:hypothetical protein